ncbi:GNAT family N-acetyltransferase [Shewanella sp. HN-41]|uniref:GNAT family N-acetyltransferase n=1 Tax=Shewanella sp. HN-41 TaxID=327275 RepID=UPI00021259FA|nr:GNAT family N-acetyltransferase [Shewanella sp. HN-41]EGM71052.1 GCN5 N-acetyltransferase [Shewanella sp. HN-41]
MISLQTSKVWLTPLSDADEDLFVELYTSARLMSKIAEPLTVERAQNAFQKTLAATLNTPPKIMSWVIRDKLANTAMGIVGFSAITYPEQAELGIILRREAHGKGVVVEVGDVLCDYALKQVGLHRIRAEHHIENRITQRILRQMGFNPPQPHKCKADTLECFLTASKFA